MSLQTNALSAIDQEKLTHLNTYNATQFFLYSNNHRDMIVHTGEGNIKLYSNQVLIGNGTPNSNLVLNGRAQYLAYTNELHNHYVNVIQDLTLQLNWVVDQRIRESILLLLAG